MSAYSGYSLFFSPNLVWLGCALLVYFLAPYDLAAAADGFAWEWISKRAVVNATFTFGYVGFWHVSLYWLGFGTRPFMPNRTYNWAKVAHNAFYTLLATVQWTAWEALAMRAWATGRLPYLPDALAFGTWSGLANFVASCFWVPLFRSWHFYFAHRGLHIRPLYKYVHSLHHRNTDIEPFAGLCMHPIEHLYYFSCAGLCLYLFASPFAFLWNGVHLLLSPAASHSGYEDNFQSDQFHYLHHKFFECNYGPSDCPLDRWFGTLCASPPLSASLLSPHPSSLPHPPLLSPSLPSLSPLSTRVCWCAPRLSMRTAATNSTRGARRRTPPPPRRATSAPWSPTPKRRSLGCPNHRICPTSPSPRALRGCCSRTPSRSPRAPSALPRRTWRRPLWRSARWRRRCCSCSSLSPPRYQPPFELRALPQQSDVPLLTPMFESRLAGRRRPEGRSRRALPQGAPLRSPRAALARWGALDRDARLPSRAHGRRAARRSRVLQLAWRLLRCGPRPWPHVSMRAAAEARICPGKHARTYPVGDLIYMCVARVACTAACETGGAAACAEDPIHVLMQLSTH
jgi:sterol desaturase/sphingolipid hydroxylase (fatty acid hydroxylase superfamily)